MGPFTTLARLLATAPKAVLVEVETVEGSAPLEAGAFMIVLPDGSYQGTIGGGALEWRALAGAQGLIGERDVHGARSRARSCAG
mgnify:CR=1 FL=1